MIRYRVYFLLICTNVLLTATENALKDKKSNPKPPDKLVLRKSKSYVEENSLVDTLSNWIKDPFTSDSSEENKDEEDLTAAASEHISARYLSPRADYEHSRNCYECNSEPWIPIVGRSLNLRTSSSHFNSLEDHDHHNSQPHFQEKHHSINKQYNLNHPPIDQYGAPQATYDYPRAGEVVDFMLPPPTRTHNFLSDVGDVYRAPPQTYGPPQSVYGQPNPPQPQYGQPNPVYSSPKPFYNFPNKNSQNIFNLSPPSSHRAPQATNLPSFNYGPPSIDISPPPATNYGAPPLISPPRNYGGPLKSYGPPGIPVNNNRLPFLGKNIPKTYLRPVSQNFQPPLPVPGVHNLPLENINPPPPVPSDSYGKPLVTAFSNSQFPNNYGGPMIRDQQQHVEPITLGSGDSDEFDGSPNYFANFEAQQNEQLKASLYQKGLTDVQVVPSIKIADFTASIEHPINIVQSPILDLNINDPNQHQSSVSDNEISNEHRQIKAKLSENPIFVDDTYTSASNINTTYFSSSNSTDLKRHNDKFISNEPFKSYQDILKQDDLTTNLIQKLILENNLIKDPQTQIIGIQKASINPKNIKTKLEVVQPSTDYSSWSFSSPNHVSTVMVPPKPTYSWLSPVNESFVTSKTSKKLQIIVPYIKATNNHIQWTDPSQKSTAIYNKEYTTLAPVFVPPPMSTESSNLWTKLVEDIRTAETHRDQAHGFGQSSSTQVYNINDFIARQQNKGANKLPYDVISLQKNIDHWTHQSYANRINFGDKLPPKQAHVKHIPQEYFTTTPSYSDNTISSELRGDITNHYDNIASSSNNKNYISGEIEDNSILTDDTDKRPSSTENVVDSTTVESVKYIVKNPEPSWKQNNEVVISNSTHEKVYVVTPQSYTYVAASTPATAFSMAPRIQNGKINNMPFMTRISVRVEAPSEKDRGKALKPVKVVYSEWPHLINNLATTTTHRPTSRHPLFGLMDLSAYTPPPNSTVETIGGHSKVTNVVTTPINKYSSTSPAPSTNSHEAAKVPPAAGR